MEETKQEVQTEDKNKLQLESKKKHLENIHRELKLIEDQIPMLQENKAVVEEERELSKQRYDIIVQDYELLDPKWKFETRDDYKQIMIKLELLASRKNNLTYQQQLTQVENNLKATSDQKESLTKELLRITKEVEELEKVN